MRYGVRDGVVVVAAGRLPPVEVRVGALVVPVLIALPLWLNLRSGGLVVAPIAVVGMVLSVLAHELGHVFAARRFGLDATVIRLDALGGEAVFAHPPRTRKQDCAITLAGPAANLAIGLACLGLYRLLMPDPWAGFVPDQPWHLPPPLPLPPLVRALRWLGWINIVWCVTNLLPAFPLDGGRLLYAVLGAWLGERRALLCTGLAGTVLAVLAWAVLIVGFIVGLVAWCPLSIPPNWAAVRAGWAQGGPGRGPPRRV